MHAAPGICRPRCLTSRPWSGPQRALVIGGRDPQGRVHDDVWAATAVASKARKAGRRS